MAKIDWNIRTRALTCTVCGKAFEAGENLRSAVLPFAHERAQAFLAEKATGDGAPEVPPEKAPPADPAPADAQEPAAPASASSGTPPGKRPPDFVRFDFCAECWKAQPKTDWISVWQSRFEPPPPSDAAQDPLRRETAESLLRTLLEGDDAENHLPAIFLLALQLERKRILKERAVRHTPDGIPVHFYEHRKSGDILLIRDPHLTDAQIPEAQAEIERLLGLRPAATPAEPAAPAGETPPEA